MLRALFQYVVPIVLPTAVYLLWLSYRRRRAAVAGTAVPAWQKGPWFWLIMAGFALSAASFVGGAFRSGHAPGSKYTPAEVKNGQVVPGQFKD